VAIVLFSALSLSRRFSRAQWSNVIAGVWLLFAPLVFWSPSAAVYTHDTLIGALVIAFAILVPMMPDMSHGSMMDVSDLPVGWIRSVNLSTARGFPKHGRSRTRPSAPPATCWKL
jgi:hypothetical protein